jgi:inorganic pyrophosphatase
MHPWHDLPTGNRPPEEITAIVEIPGGSRNKYELDKDSGLFRLDRVLYSAVHYPGDYGFVPRTISGDNDPCDVLVLIREPTFTGCAINVRPIGVLMMHDRDEPDEKIICVPAQDPFQNEYFDIADIPSHQLAEIEHFFQIYKDLEGRRVQLSGWAGNDAAKLAISDGMNRYSREFAM